ncbi:MAG: ATP-dependent DNA helicase RecG [Clostridiales bacterium]|nr:ATP-dependent DNA helicase RecG [Candidatus Equinaster intestinalis]
MISGNTDIRYLKGVGEKRAQFLAKLGIESVGALLNFYPRGYRDLSETRLIYDTNLFENVCIKAQIVSPVKEHRIRANMVLYKFRVMDASGTMQVTLFNTKYLAERLHEGSTYIFYGKTSGGIFSREMSSPEIYEEGNNSILPIYPLTGGITVKYLSSIIKTALENYEYTENLPQEILQKYGLCDIRFALNNIHFPLSKETLEKARKRLVFEELFVLQCGMQYFSVARRGYTSCVIKNDFTAEFLKLLPYSATDSQKKCIEECTLDMQKNVPMNRLLQGDVGSGKTTVAAAIMYNAAKNGYQSVLMAPTVILAEQHFHTFSRFFENTNIKCVLLTSAKTAAQKRKLYEQIENGDADIIIGTSALISEGVNYNRVGLVITDEQHRFGVIQRAKLTEEGNRPHTLVMSATPIPRTLSFVIYGDMDVSIIDEYPRGRQKIDTHAVTANLRKRAYNFLRENLDAGGQGYIICPLVEDGEAETGRFSAQTTYDKLKTTFFKNYRLGLLHGKMAAAQKEDIMRQFSAGEIDLLIATTVVEVGIDVPNATVMIIENAECFGLAALHQLRGRIGRGSAKSTCILISDTAENNARLGVVRDTLDGFKIAEEDLKLRGPGDFIGQRQHGLPELKIADIAADYDTLLLTRNAAKELIKNDPHLLDESHKPLKENIESMFKNI